MVEVTVRCEWESTDTFEFETLEEAQQFWDRVHGGDLNAIVKAGDVTSGQAELVGWDVAGRRPSAPAGEETKAC